jgi:hypothetical protein
MHDTESMLADLREAIADMPDTVTIVHRGGHRETLSGCAISDITGANRVMEDEGIMEQADISITYAAADLRFPAETGDTVLRGALSYRVLRPRFDRGGVSVTLECKEDQ